MARLNALPAFLLILGVAQGYNRRELILVHVLWRNGDRSPLKTFRTDPIKEVNWTFGGGGFGQLSPKGMEQHFYLGKLLRKIYVDSGFLSPQYSSKEIYLRSTDYNRTIISAISNILGMYSQQNYGYKDGVDYPNITGWPSGYVPIAVHTTALPIDYVGRPNFPCYRRYLLWRMALFSTEMQELMHSKEVLELLNFLREKCGQTISIDNLATVRDPLFVEQIYFNDSLRALNPWFFSIYDKLNDVFAQAERYKYGLFKSRAIMDDVDLSYELMKVQGGPLLNEIVDRINNKIECLNINESECKWLNGLKYYVYSTHDSTLYQFFVLLGIEEKIVSGPLLEYAAATTVELWIDKIDRRPYFRLMYHPGDGKEIYPVTNELDGCGGSEYCDLEILRNIASRFRIEMPISEFCRTDPKYTKNACCPLMSWISLALAFSVILLM